MEVSSRLWSRALRLMFLFCASLLAAGTLVACGEDDSGPGSLTVYSGRSEELVAPIIKQFVDATRH